VNDLEKLCARTACKKPGAAWWNLSTRDWYCQDCAEKINEAAGHKICLHPLDLYAIQCALAPEQSPTAQIVEELQRLFGRYIERYQQEVKQYGEAGLEYLVPSKLFAELAKSLPETKGEVAVEFPSDANRSLVEIFYLKDHEPFVCGVYGKVTGDQIAKIERDCAENPGVGFGKGDGQYLFSCHWEPGQYGDEGRCEIAPYWHLDLIAFKPIPLEKPKGGV
jgi:hypothetical protein